MEVFVKSFSANVFRVQLYYILLFINNKKRVKFFYVLFTSTVSFIGTCYFLQIIPTAGSLFFCLLRS